MNEVSFLLPQLAGQGSSSTLHIKTEELSRQYREQLEAMRREKDQEIQRLRVRTIFIQLLRTSVVSVHSDLLNLAEFACMYANVGLEDFLSDSFF